MTKQNLKPQPDKVRTHGMVFTPDSLVNDMLDKLPKASFKDDKTFLDNSCGTGNFLLNILNRKMANGITHIDALKQIYGCELCPKNTEECRERLSLDSDDKDVWDILNVNIITADALDPSHPGWNESGYYWMNV